MLNSISSYLRNNKELVAIFLVALIVRLIQLNGFSLSNDELSALSRIQYKSLSDVINKGVLIDFHPAGVQVFLYYYVKLFGDSAFILRLPFALFGAFSVALAYLIANKWFGKFCAVMSSVALSLLIFPLLYSQVERPYASGLFFALLMVYCWNHILFEKNRKTLHALLFALSTACCMYNHYFSFLFAIIVGATGLLFLNKENYKYYLTAPLLSVILFLPHLKLTITQISRGGLSDWLGKPESNAFSKYLFYCANDSLLVLSVFILSLLAVLIINLRNKSFNKFHFISFLWFLLPFCIAYYYSLYVNPVLQHSIMLFSFPFLLFFLFSYNIYKYRYIHMICWAAVLSYSTFLEKKYYSTQHLSEFEKLAVSIKETKDNYKPYVAIGTFNNPFYMDYYFNKLGIDFKFDLGLIEGIPDMRKCDSILNTTDAASCYYVWSCRANFPDIENLIRVRYPEKARRESYFMEDYKISEFSLFKKGTDNRQILTETFANFKNPDPSWEIDKAFTDSINGKFKFTDKNEYGLVFNSTVENILANNNTTLQVSGEADIKPNTEAVVVFNVVNDSTSVFWDARPLNLYYYKGDSITNFYYVAQYQKTFKPTDKVKVFIWNRSKENFTINNFKIKLYEND